MRIAGLLSALLLLGVTSLVSCSNDPCTKLGLQSSYDAIVVGSGPGGVVAARRLAEVGGGKLQVLLVERGPAYSECSQCTNPDYTIDVDVDPRFGYNFNLQPQANIIGNPVYPVNEVALQGGGSSHNGMVWIRADGPHYFNTFWPDNWNWTTLINYYAKVETYTYPNGFYGPANDFNYAANYRGQNGLIKVTQFDVTYSNGLAGDIIRAAKVVWPNIPATTNGSLNNGFYPGFGAAPPESSQYNGVRSSGYPGYIGSYTGHNLHSISHVRVNKVLFSGTVVSGVELVFVNESGKANSTTCHVATNTVVVSSGLFGTPKLLKLSGVGPSRELNKLGIPVVVDAPLVGTNMDDQFGISVLCSGTAKAPITSTAWRAPGALFYNVEDNPLLPGDIGINVDIYTLDNVTYANTLVELVYAESKGTVLLASANPDDEPVVNPDYLASGRDRVILGEGLNQVIALAKEIGFDIAVNPCSTLDCSTINNQLNAYLSYQLGTPGDHWSGTAGIERVLDPLTMGVWDTTGLYVLDSSAFPRSPGENTQYTTYAVSEFGITLVIADHQARGKWCF